MPGGPQNHHVPCHGDFTRSGPGTVGSWYVLTVFCFAEYHVVESLWGRDVFGTCASPFPPPTASSVPMWSREEDTSWRCKLALVASPMLPVPATESYDLQRILDEHGDIRLFFQVRAKLCPVLSAPEMVEMAPPRHVCHIIGCSCPHDAFHFRTRALLPCLSLALYLIRNLPLLQSQTALLTFTREPPWRESRAHVCCCVLGVQT